MNNSATFPPCLDFDHRYVAESGVPLDSIQFIPLFIHSRLPRPFTPSALALVPQRFTPLRSAAARCRTMLGMTLRMLEREAQSIRMLQTGSLAGSWPALRLRSQMWE